VAHRNARTTVYARRLIVERRLAGWPAARIAEQLGISRATVHKWLRRHRDEGWPGLADRSSRPHTSPTRTPVQVEAQILTLRRRAHRGPVFLAGQLGLVASTVGRVLRRHHVPALAATDPITGALVRRRHSGIRYERSRPGELVHVDVKKLGRVPDGGGWRLHGRDDNPDREAHRGRGIGYDFLHVAVDDHTRLAYVEALADERDLSCAGFLRLVPRTRRRHRAGAHRQRQGLPGRPALDHDLHRAEHRPPVHPTRLPLDQRQGRTVQPDPAHRVRLRPALAVQHRPARRPGRLGQRLQHSTRPLRPRRPSTHQPTRPVDNVMGHDS
jgi:transposase